MKLQQEEKILALFFKKETVKEKTLRLLSSVIKFTRRKIEGFVKWIYYPSIEPRSMFALERSQLVKNWPKAPNLKNKLKQIKERQSSLRNK